MNKQQNDNKKKEEPAEERGKKAIDAGKKAKGENPEDPKVKEKEKKDADVWRNEG